jgi:hypothetical protein
MPELDTKRIFDCWARIRRQNDPIVKIDGDIRPFFCSELRQNMLSAPPARRSKMSPLHWAVVPTTGCGAQLASYCSGDILFLRVLQENENSKSEDSSRRKTFSHMHHTLHKHAIYCTNIIWSVLERIWCVVHMLFESQFWSQCPREISTAQNTTSHQSDIVSEQEQVHWDHKHVLYRFALRFGLHRVMKFGP